jgi:hypothetical protein
VRHDKNSPPGGVPPGQTRIGIAMMIALFLAIAAGTVWAVAR